MSDNLVQLPSIHPRDLAVRIIDSDEDRLRSTHAMVQTMLPEEVEVTSARHPEVVRKELELLAEGEESTYTKRKYNIFLPRTKFQNYNSLFTSRMTSFDDEKSVRKLDDHTGVFKMLRTYWDFLTQAGGKFFNAFLIDSSDANPQMFDDYETNIHLANYPNPTEKVENQKITQIQLIDGEEDFSRGQLEKMFVHFDKLVEADSYK